MAAELFPLLIALLALLALDLGAVPTRHSTRRRPVDRARQHRAPRPR
jgi:hypothetical protein